MIYFGICVLAFFAIIGICDFCRGIVQRITRTKDDREIILIEPICQKQGDAEYLLRSAAQKVMWMGRFAPDRVICLDCNMDSETRRLCQMVCNEYPFMELYTKDEMCKRIDSII